MTNPDVSYVTFKFVAMIEAVLVNYILQYSKFVSMQWEHCVNNGDELWTLLFYNNLQVSETIFAVLDECNRTFCMLGNEKL